MKRLLIITFTIFIYATQGMAQSSEGNVKIRTNPNIDKLVNERIAFNKANKTMPGYRIQLFYGSEKSALKERDRFKQLFPDIRAKIVFSSPEWKVQVGNYLTRLDADSDLIEIKKHFPAAIVLQTDIDIEPPKE